ncbi:hypothetical protein [Pontibacter liquoris]|uniref:hypothetical protein n=1 Tax=Pontibacter liquoris TaxID=2905677 RepID=UPI001FA7C87E|nr:hypothetical protein [Pontibacter liquoris]
MAKNRLFLLLSFVLLGGMAVSCKPRCPIASCQVRMLHRHGEQEFRGQPIWKKQNPKMGEKLPKTSKESSGPKHDKSRNKN